MGFGALTSARARHGLRGHVHWRRKPEPPGQPHETPVTQDTSQAEDTGAVTSGTPVSDHHNQSLSSTTEGDTNSTDAKESFSETCQAIFGCGPSSLPGSLTGSPSSVPGSLADRPSCVPEPPADNPSILPGSLPNNPSILPGSLPDNPSCVAGSLADNPSILPGPTADNPSILPGPPTDSPLILPGSLPDNLFGVPRSLADNPSTLLGPQADRPVYVPGSHADNPFYLPGPRALSPSSHHSSLSDSSSSTCSSSSPASPSWSYGSSSSGCSPVSDVDNSDTNQLDVSNSSQSSPSSSGSEDHVPRYTAGTIQYKAVADKQSDWKGQVLNYFEQKFVSPKDIPDVQPCPAFNQTSSFTAAGVSPDDNYTIELKSSSCCKDVRPKETTAVLRTSPNIWYSSPTDSEGLRFMSLENEPEKRLFCDLDPPVSKRGSDDSFRMDSVHEKDNPGPDIYSNIGNKEISSTMTENDEHISPKRHFPQMKFENISRGTRGDQDFKRMFPIPKLTRRNKCLPGVFVSPDSVGTRRIKRLSEDFTGSDSAIGALCMPSKKIKTDTPGMSRARKRLGKWLK
ncbi:uncharacterized protein LOC124271035 [Haliotis rubra]|uniref:uncharacterized protein LOC124271035 n=1 Tax=Haliotis rubra TaxID=36100 RepID=UPI001EE53749|nr:uncharacterized protein LOC124271035 [Haliotis rubra]